MKIKVQSGFKWDDEKGADIDEVTVAVWEAFEQVTCPFLNVFGINSCAFDRNTRVLPCSTTRVGYGSRKSSLSCQPLHMVQMHIMLLRDLSCLKLKARNLIQSQEFLFLIGCIFKFRFFYWCPFLFSHLHLYPRITGWHPSC